MATRAECAGTVHVFVDAEHPTVFVTGHFTHPVTVLAEYENWRTGPRLHPASGSLRNRRRRAGAGRGDPLLSSQRSHHHPLPGQTGSRRAALRPPFPTACRTASSAGWCGWRAARSSAEGRLATPAPVHAFNLQVTTHSAQVPDAAELDRRPFQLAAEAHRPTDAQARTARWWNAYWEQSWIFVEGDRPAQPGLDASLLQLRLEPQDAGLHARRGSRPSHAPTS